ncbi:hypothetical protein [Nocardia testacea]|uniref:hypothetical protein n=1 Tax=Nocardia testacea TaxID=248551 RepID=UPI003A883994
MVGIVQDPDCGLVAQDQGRWHSGGEFDRCQITELRTHLVVDAVRIGRKFRGVQGHAPADRIVW